MTDEKQSPPIVHLMIPDMPSARDLAPWLDRIDGTRHYTNFGPLVREFESRVEQELRTKALELEPGSVRVVSASSGTTALELAISALRLRDNAKVLLPALTFPATATAVLRCGASVVFTDVDPGSWILTPEIALAALDCQGVDLVVPVAAFGRPLPANAWDRFVQATGIPVLMDAAAAFGSQIVGRRCITVFSLHATKTLSTGEGGLVAACSDDFTQRVRQLSNFGFNAPSRVGTAGQNAKLSEYHAAVGLAQLERLEQVRSRRERVWQTYQARLSAMARRVQLQESAREFVRAILPVALPERGDAERVAIHLDSENIQTRRWYCPPLHEHPGFLGSAVVGPGGDSELPVTAALGTRLLGLPFHSFLSDFEIARVCSVLSRCLESRRQRRRETA